MLVLWARAFADLTQEGLAEAAGVSKAAVCRYEKGAPVRRKTLARLGQAVRLSLSFFEACWGPAIRAARALSRGLVPSRPLSNPRAQARAMGEMVEAMLVSAVTSLEVETEAALPTADELLGLLLRQPREKRLLLLEADADFNTWPLAVRLCEESVAAAGHSPEEAIHLAELALALTQRVKGARGWKARLAGFCQAFVANALRVAGDFDAAEAAFTLVWQLWREGAGGDAAGLLPAWRLFDLEASLRRDQERFSEALDQVEMALEACPRSVAGRILVKKASILEAAGEREQAVATLQAADPLVDGDKDVRLRTCLLFNLAINLCHLERLEEAAGFLPEIRQLNEQLRNRYDAARCRWLEGTIAAGRGLGGEAQTALEEVRAEFRRLGNEHEVALVSLELAHLYLEAGGRTAEVQEIAREVCPYFTRLGLPRSTASAVELFCAAAEQEIATAAMVRQLLSRLGRRA